MPVSRRGDILCGSRMGCGWFVVGFVGEFGFDIKAMLKDGSVLLSLFGQLTPFTGYIYDLYAYARARIRWGYMERV
jgi:hypothetical protein